MCPAEYEHIKPPEPDFDDDDLHINRPTKYFPYEGLQLLLRDESCQRTFSTVELVLRLITLIATVVLYIGVAAKFFVLKRGVHPELRRAEAPLTVASLVSKVLLVIILF